MEKEKNIIVSLSLSLSLWKYSKKLEREGNSIFISKIFNIFAMRPRSH